MSKVKFTRYLIYMVSGNTKQVVLTEGQKADLDYCINNQTVFAIGNDFIVAKYITNVECMGKEEVIV